MMRKKVPENITTIIFDLGGVLFDIDYSLTQKAFQELGAVRDFKTLYSLKQQAELFDEFEKGNLSPSQFRKELKNWLPSTMSDREIDIAWNALLIGIPRNKMELLILLKSRYRLLLLSNTNLIHLPAVLQMIEKSHPEWHQLPIFEKEYYSCDIRMRKPDREIYERVITENSLLPSKTLFIDDNLQNVEGAEKTGIQGLHCTGDVNLGEYFGI
jgi:glucose-1-phosphatase